MNVQDENYREKMEDSFDTAYLRMMESGREKQLSSKLENVELAYVRMMEKYGDYGDCRLFVEYIRTVEKIFTEAKFRNWDADKSKDELIRSKIGMMASVSPIGEDMLSSIYNDFKKAGADIGKVYDAANDLLEKYQGNPECREFILYVQNLFINFHGAQQEALGLDTLKERLVRARMEVLASGGNPDLIELEKIYGEFKALIGEGGNRV